MPHCSILNANKAVGCGISNLDKCRPEAAGDVISGMAIDYLGRHVRANLGDYRLNSGQIIRLFVRPDAF